MSIKSITCTPNGVFIPVHFSTLRYLHIYYVSLVKLYLLIVQNGTGEHSNAYNSPNGTLNDKEHYDTHAPSSLTSPSHNPIHHTTKNTFICPGTESKVRFFNNHVQMHAQAFCTFIVQNPPTWSRVDDLFYTARSPIDTSIAEPARMGYPSNTPVRL